jgi:exonuclease III
LQDLLFSRVASGPVPDGPADPQPGRRYRLLAVNVQNPGAERAQRLVAALAGEAFDVLVLSELQGKPACQTLLSELRALGYQTTALPDGDGRAYHTAIASRLRFDELAVETPSLAGRIRVARFRAGAAKLYLVGVYGITFNARNVDQRRRYKADFEDRILGRLSGVPAGVVIAGDLNILEPRFHDHLPDQVADDRDHYRRFAERGFADLVRAAYPDRPEYTWYSPRTLEGQRLDHLFAGATARAWIDDLTTRHDLRRNKLTDHSAIAASLTLPGTEPEADRPRAPRRAPATGLPDS